MAHPVCGCCLIPASSTSPGFIIAIAGRGITVGGTSVGTPIWAGFAALLVQQKGRLGLLNHELYRLGAAQAVHRELRLIAVRLHARLHLHACLVLLGVQADERGVEGDVAGREIDLPDEGRGLGGAVDLKAGDWDLSVGGIVNAYYTHTSCSGAQTVGGLALGVFALGGGALVRIEMAADQGRYAVIGVEDWFARAPDDAVLGRLRDVVEGPDGAQVFIDPKSLPFVDGTELDYDTALLSKGFVLNNPNAKSTLHST